MIHAQFAHAHWMISNNMHTELYVTEDILKDKQWNEVACVESLGEVDLSYRGPAITTPFIHSITYPRMAPTHDIDRMQSTVAINEQYRWTRYADESILEWLSRQCGSLNGDRFRKPARKHRIVYKKELYMFHYTKSYPRMRSGVE